MSRFTLVSVWPDLEAAFKLDAQAFDVEGVDLLASAKVTGGTGVGPNIRFKVNGGGFTVELPEDYDAGDFTLRFRVRASYEGEGKGAKFSLQTEKNMWDFVHRAGEWFAPTGGGAELVMAVEERAWADFAIAVSDASTDNVKFQRTFACTVNGKTLVAKGQFNGALKQLVFESRASACTVGGVEIQR
jgi:hypothetical protein